MEKKNLSFSIEPYTTCNVQEENMFLKIIKHKMFFSKVLYPPNKKCLKFGLNIGRIQSYRQLVLFAFYATRHMKFSTFNDVDTIVVSTFQVCIAVVSPHTFL